MAIFSRRLSWFRARLLEHNQGDKGLFMTTTTAIPVSEYLATTYEPTATMWTENYRSATWVSTITAAFSCRWGIAFG